MRSQEICFSSRSLTTLPFPYIVNRNIAIIKDRRGDRAIIALGSLFKLTQVFLLCFFLLYLNAVEQGDGAQVSYSAERFKAAEIDENNGLKLVPPSEDYKIWNLPER
ncbi:hypothetical protein L6164_015449 [Bauhinia variegata]|uniref:Uncharacterized protein n=1 Tax=Bauhinia variegata TaxID=167791 RepID=A0ACB9NMD5_BAUVA|nr:hypothetical protein L6164_015449 [Bauhinia variegata]